MCTCSFLKQAKKVGVDGILIVDLPLEEAKEYLQGAKEVNLDTIFIVSPSTPKERIEKISNASSSFLYYACRKGTTGIKKGLPEDFEEKMKEIKAHSNLPVAVGFGISNAAGARQVLKCGDAFVVGSLFVQAIGDGNTPQELTQLAKTLDPRKL